MEKFEEFNRIAEIEYSDIVLSTQDLGNKLRIYLKDKSFIDFYFTKTLKIQKFSIHWERSHIDAVIYRIDNTPDKKWESVNTFPIHFHNKNYNKVEPSPFPIKQNEALKHIFRKFLNFVRNKKIST